MKRTQPQNPQMVSNTMKSNQMMPNNVQPTPNEARSALDELKKKMQMSKQMNQQQQPQQQPQQQQYSMNKQQPMKMGGMGEMKKNDPYGYNDNYNDYGNSSGGNYGNQIISNKQNTNNKIYAQESNNEIVDDLSRSPCTVCGRMFAMESLAKHTKICKKNATKKKRREFDMKKKRMVDGEQASLMKYGAVANKKIEQKKAMQKGGPKWLKQSEEFRNALKESRRYEAQQKKLGGGGFTVMTNNNSKYGQKGMGYGGGMNKQAGYGGGMGKQMGGGGGMGKQMGMGGGMPQNSHFQPSTINDDYTLCQYCQRRYNDEAYSKHAPGCERRFKETQARSKMMQKPQPKKK